MAFNLFCPFIEMLEKGKGKEVGSIFRAVFPDKGIKTVEQVELEYLHTDIEYYLNDKTAMDAIIRYVDNEGKKSFIAIETKYTDVLGTNSASKTMLHKAWIKRLAEFKKESEEKLLNNKKPISQIYRNLDLYAKKIGRNPSGFRPILFCKGVTQNVPGTLSAPSSASK